MKYNINNLMKQSKEQSNKLIHSQRQQTNLGNVVD